MTSPKPPSPPSGRTKIIAAVSIGAVVVATLFAIGANLGILTNTDDTKVGALSAAGDLVPSSSQVVDVYLDPQGVPSTTESSGSTAAQRFAVDSAGTVDVSAGPDGPHIDLIVPAGGWTATPVTASGPEVSVTFTDGTRTLQFTATVGADGVVAGDVTETTGATSADPAAPGPSDDDHEDEREDHEDEAHEYEGGDSDD